ncbi:MAG: ATP-binding protein [Bifidobacteriaceae bacterium]|jgi:predicted AAA+ superfamily ATPase|nr:ATP-binding protein [Bifidobacteriaceae bacterium]
MIKRKLEDKVRKFLGTENAIILFGARQVGKTTLLENLMKKKDNILWYNLDDTKDAQEFRVLLEYPEDYLDENVEYLVIDEAQQMEDIGRELKVLHDKYKKSKLQIIATGSSSFDLANEVNEPMTGRKWEFQMQPVTFSEMSEYHGLEKEKSLLENRLIYGHYPKIVTSTEDNARDNLSSLANSILYKDVLKWGNIRKSTKIENLLETLAYQIGSTVNYTEIASSLELDKITVEKYINLLEQAFIIFRLKTFSRNLRNEIKTKRKIYFYDLGIRNAVIDNFDKLENRDDEGKLFENFIISEMIKKRDLKNYYYWRSAKQQEVDLVELVNGKINAYEIKWNPKRFATIPKYFIEKYLPLNMKIINRENFDQFLL